jgi:hypothetical protein
MTFIKKTKVAIYCFSIVISASSLVLIYFLVRQEKVFFEDIGETTGTALGVLMGFEMVLFFFIQALKRKLIPQIILKPVVKLTRVLRQYHNCVGALTLSVLLFHVSLTLDLSNPLKSDFVTGYMVTTLVVLSVVFGLFYKPKRKNLSLLHIIFAFLALLPFLLHVS